MRGLAICTALAAAGAAGCLHDPGFKCLQDADCGMGGTCEPIGYCSIANAQCTGTGRSFSDSAGQGLSNTCVPALQCPADYVAIAGSLHRYKRIPAAVSWDQARIQCAQAGAAAYLLVPDDATELKNLATVASPPFWIGLDDQATAGRFVTPKNAPAMFLPWASGEPRPGEHCVKASSGTQIATDLCSAKHAAVCECEP